jgi:predicted dehydrogenase
MLRLADIDAVAIAVPPGEQAPIVECALEAGKAVFAEKPLALNCKSTQRLADLAQSRGLPNVVDYSFVATNCFGKAKNELESGRIGALRHINVDWRLQSHAHRTGQQSWKTNDELGGGVLFHFGSHVLQYVEWLGGPIARVSAIQRRDKNAADVSSTVCVIMVEFLSGVTGSIVIANNFPGMFRHRVDIHGTQGTLSLVNKRNFISGFALYFYSQEIRKLIAQEDDPPDSVDERVPVVARHAKGFLDWIRTGTQCDLPTFNSATRVAKLTSAVYRSNGSVVQV